MTKDGAGEHCDPLFRVAGAFPVLLTRTSASFRGIIGSSEGENTGQTTLVISGHWWL